MSSELGPGSDGLCFPRALTSVCVGVCVCVCVCVCVWGYVVILGRFTHLQNQPIATGHSGAMLVVGVCLQK
jgi:hypothetical protein